MTFKPQIEWIVDVFESLVVVVSQFYDNYAPDFITKSFERGFSEALGFELYNSSMRNIEIKRQDNPLQADSITAKDYGTLEMWGLGKIGRGPFVESGGEYLVEFEGTGGIYEAGQKFTNTSTGFQYTLKERLFINSGFKSARINLSMTNNLNGPSIRLFMSNEVANAWGVVKSDTGGFKSALIPGTLLSSNNINSGINNPALVISVEKDPTENETIQEYREDVLLGYRVPPRGGARGDYVLWSEKVSGVKRAYPYAGDNNDILGAMWLLIESTFNDGVATPELLDSVLREIDIHIPLSDTGVILQTVEVARYTIYVQGITGVDLKDLDNAKISINNSLDIYIQNLKAFIDGVDRTTEKNDKMLRIELVSIVQDNVSIYGGFVGDVFWNVLETVKEVEQGKVFRLGGVVYI